MVSQRLGMPQNSQASASLRCGCSSAAAQIARPAWMSLRALSAAIDCGLDRSAASIAAPKRFSATRSAATSAE